MKVGILTIQNCENFGAVLQASATVRILEQLGAEAELIDYSTPDLIGANKLFNPPTSKRAIIDDVRHLLKVKKYKGRSKKFADYKSKYYKLGQNVATNPADWEKLNAEYGTIIVGSDQTFNLHLKGDPEYRKIYFLDFFNGKKLSFASSFGESGTALSPEEKEFIGASVKKFDYVSVRDEKSRRLLGELAGVDADVVLDPTLAVDRSFWENMTAPENGEDYIFFYTVLSEPWVVEEVEKLSKKTGMKVIAAHLPNRFELGKSFERRIDCGPVEFLNYIRNARYVFTTSFHATAFSLIFGKEFWSCKIGEGNRIGSLLNQVSLSERMVSKDSFPEEYPDMKIDYGAVSAKLSAERERSLECLGKAMRENGNLQ